MLKTTKCYIRNCSKRWEEDSDKNRQLVTEEDVVSVVSVFLVHKVVSENENKKLSKMRDAIR
jgi:hypothetical protein